MKTLKNLAMATLMSGVMAVSNPAYSQDSETKKQDNLNFYFETKENVLKSWLCECSKEEKRGVIWFYYKDINEDGFYEDVSIQKNNPSIKTKETFWYNIETKEVNYQLAFYDFSTGEFITNKHHPRITQEEAKNLGEDFLQRINKFVKVQKDFSRFNLEPLEKLVREEYDYRLKLVDGKLVGNSKIPIEKILEEYEIEKVENYNSPAEKTRRKEEEEKRQAILERERMEKEMKKLSEMEMTVKIGGGLMKTINSLWRYEAKAGFLFEATPQLNIKNPKGRGIAAGLNLWLSNSIFSVDGYSYENDEEPILWVGTAVEYRITNTEYKISKDIKSSSGTGLNLGYVSPLLEVFLGLGISRQKISESTTIKKEEYVEKYGVIQDSTRTESQETTQKNYGRSIFYGNLGMEISPFFKKEDSIKNLSFFMEISRRMSQRAIGGGYLNFEPAHQSAFKAGLKYTFRK